MSIKVQSIAVLLTAGAALSAAAPFSLVSRNTAYKLPFDESTLKKVLKDANSIYTISAKDESLEEIISEEKIKEFIHLVQKIRERKKEDIEVTKNEINLTSEDRQLLTTFYATYSLLDKRKSEDIEDDEKFDIKPSLFKNSKTVRILRALDNLNWGEDATDIITKSKQDTNDLRYFYGEKLQKLGTKKEDEVIIDISEWLLKEMEIIHKDYF